MSSTDPLIKSGDLVYQYSFTLPKIGTTDAEGFPYGGSAIAFNPARNSLFIVGYELAHKVAEVTVPAAGGIATVLQPLVDVTEGRINSINPTDTNTKFIGGLLPWGTKLIVSAYSSYDGSGKQVLSHFVSGQILGTAGDVFGPFQVGSTPIKAGYVSGYMGVVPQAWRTALGGPAFTGNAALAIVSRTSQGPAVCTFDPDAVGVSVPCPASALVYYDALHPLGPYNSANPLYNGTAKIAGVVMPEGSRSVLFFGRIGSTFCYGSGTTNPALAGQPVPNEPGVIYCYDPEDQSKGTHGYPYRYQVWAYDANDLAAVKAGSVLPWAVKPYATWALTFPNPAPFTRIMGAAYDPATQRLFVSQFKGDGNKPRIHVYKIAVALPPPPVPVKSVTLTSARWLLTVTDDPPDVSGGWSVQFYQGPNVTLGTLVTAAPYTQSTLVTAGTYSVSAVWMKASEADILRSVSVVVCP